MRRRIAAVGFILCLAAVFLAGARPVRAWCQCVHWQCESDCNAETSGCPQTCSCNETQCTISGVTCPAGFYVCNRGCCDIGTQNHPKPDNSGCYPDEYMGRCYKCNLICKDGECWEKCKIHDWTCCPCGSLDIDPDNLTATPVSETSVRLDWTPKGTFYDNEVLQYVQWTNNPSYYGQCNVYSSENPCNKAGPLPGSQNSYTLTGLFPNTTYFIEVDGYQGLTGSCPAANYMEYLFYPPWCWLTPESAA